MSAALKQAASPVVIERGRIWIKVGVRAFMLDYKPDDDKDAEWYAKQLSDALSSFTPDVKEQHSPCAGWRGIDTLPNEGVILAWGKWLCHPFMAEMSGGDWVTSGRVVLTPGREITHWMPLPPAPQQGGKT